MSAGRAGKPLKNNQAGRCKRSMVFGVFVYSHKYAFRFYQPLLMYQRLVLICFLLTGSMSAKSQVLNTDSLRSLLALERVDSNKVRLLNELAEAYQLAEPARSIEYAQQAHDLAAKKHIEKGESRALGNIATVYDITANYNKAMDIRLQQLALAEKGDNKARLAAIIMNLGVLCTEQQDYPKALQYFLQSDSIIRQFRSTQKKFDTLILYSYQNLAELYDRVNNTDSAFVNNVRLLNGALQIKDPYFLAAAYLGLGNYYARKKEYQEAFGYYRNALANQLSVKNEDSYCETLKQMAKLYREEKKYDSAFITTRQMLAIARKAGFAPKILDGVTLLADCYNDIQKPDSALKYIKEMVVWKDSINSRDKIRDFQQKAMNEEIRQAELVRQRLIEEKERFQQMQLLLIGISIPVFFLFTVLLSKRKVHIRLIRILGVVSILLVFEYLTLLLHPMVQEFTHHTPILELLIFVCIAAVLIPSHHRIEHWLIERLTHKHRHTDTEHIQVKASRIKLKGPSNG